METLRELKEKKILSLLQRQAIIKLIEKPNKDKRLIQNRRPISHLNVDQKIILKAPAARLKKVLPFLISPGQTFGESCRLTADILETTNLKNIESYLLATDFEKAFDSLDHDLLIAVLEKCGFGHDFIDWVINLLKNQKSCMMNGGHTTHYFNLQRDTRQGNPISVYLFILVLEIFFILTKSNKNNHGITIFKH